jgi:hypothetical protein
MRNVSSLALLRLSLLLDLDCVTLALDTNAVLVHERT